MNPYDDLINIDNRLKYRVLAMLCMMAAIAYIQRAALSVPAKEIATDLQFHNVAGQMGLVQSVWYFSYALMQLPGGFLADRVGSRRAVAMLAIIWSLATLAAAFAQSFISLVLIWGLMGAAQAGAFPCAAKALGQLFEDHQRARATGFLASGMMIGGATAPLLASFCLNQLQQLSENTGFFRWQLLLGLFSIPGLFWAITFLTVLPPFALSNTNAITNKKQSIRWSAMFQSRSLLLLCAQQFFRAAGMVFFLTWFPTFLQETRGVSLAGSGLMTTIAGIGGVIGSLTGGFCSDWILQQTNNPRMARQGIAVVGMATCSILIIASYFVVDINTSIALISIGAFSASFGGVSGYTVAISFGGSQVATVFGTMNMCGNLGAALFPLSAGWLVNFSGNWNLMLFFFAAIMAIDAICWALLNPRGTLTGD
jgi:MFS family permease